MRIIYKGFPLKGDDISLNVIATVTGSKGSTPQKPGSSALFDGSRLIAGTVGGGILEAKVQAIAMESSRTGKSGHYFFNLNRSAEDGEDALCGGEVSVLIDADLKKNIHVFSALNKALSSRITGVLVTRVIKQDNSNVVVRRYFATEQSLKSQSSGLPLWIEQQATEVISHPIEYDFCEIRPPVTERTGSDLFFMERITPPYRLLIAGAGHIGRALARIAQTLGFEITVADDRSGFASSDYIPWADNFKVGNIGNIVRETDKNRDLFIVIVTRGHRDDSEALRACIDSDAAYIGMIGSRNKIALMQKEYLEKGWATRAQWDRIYAPIGLEIGSKTVEEIAVSIAAQLVKVKNQPGATGGAEVDIY